MKLRDVVRQIEIDPRKLTNYALNLDSPKGADKAIVFRSALGFTRENYTLLMQQIVAMALDAEASVRELDEHGQRYRVDLEIIGVEGQREMVRTGWIVAEGSDIARLTTLYVP
ncbi:hypothetical protein LEP3755_05460 [Leptolyngbya sp. NIES-3755]|nr:hypothetical protein LEP3755_05460 [Leptolyngbya sp. NIES-3755]